MKSDAELLRDFHRGGDQNAFRVLVERHAPLVYGTALRRTSDPEAARDISQHVFLLLAKKAARLYAGSGLAGWLHRATVLNCSNAARSELRRTRAMDRYTEHLAILSEAHRDQWAAALPEVDNGIARLPEKDRHVLIEHFLQGRSYQEIAAADSTTEAAVQRRASRAVQTLSSWLKRRRAALPVAAVLCGLQSMRADAMPAGLSAALAKGTAAGLQSFSATQCWRFRWREALAFGKKKLALSAAVALIPIALGVGGFVVGRSAALSERAALTLRADQAAASARLQAAMAEAKPEPARLPRSVREIVEEAAAHYMNEADPAGAARGEIVLGNLAPGDVPEALRCLGERIHHRALAGTMVPHLLQFWGPATSGDESVRWVVENVKLKEVFGASLNMALRGWSSTQNPVGIHEAPSFHSLARRAPLFHPASGLHCHACHRGVDRAMVRAFRTGSAEHGRVHTGRCHFSVHRPSARVSEPARPARSPAGRKITRPPAGGVE